MSENTYGNALTSFGKSFQDKTKFGSKLYKTVFYISQVTTFSNVHQFLHLTFSENGQTEQHEADETTTGNNNGITQVVVYGENKYGISHSEDQPPPTYELALKMMTKECSLGALPNETVFWIETEAINNQQLPNNTVASERITSNI